MVKTSVRDLALFGGEPAFGELLHVGRPNIGSRAAFLRRVNELLDRRWLTNGGPFVQEFERKLAEFLGVKHCVAMCNATVALEITVRALGLQGEVILPSFTFVASAHALQWQGIKPVFCDIDPLTHNIDPRRIEELITPRTSGILGVHIWGRPCPVGDLSNIAQKHDLRLLFDAAHALGSAHQGQMIGGFGDAEVFSFHATKFFNTFEGGAVATNDDALAEKIRWMHNFGFVDLDEVIGLGTNGKMSEVAAAMGLTSLESLDQFIAANRSNYGLYSDGLGGISGFRLTEYREEQGDRYNYQYLVAELDEESTGLPRDVVLRILHAENILARRYFYPGCHRMEPYRSCDPNAGLALPRTEELTQRVLQLPTGTAMGSAEIARTCEVIRFVCANAGEIARRLH